MSPHAPSLVLSHYQAAPLLEARRAGMKRSTASPDLGLSTVEVALEAGGVRFPGGEALSWEALAEIRRSENACFRVEDGRAVKIAAFSEVTGRPCSLMPTPGAPTLLIAGTLMHRIKGTDPMRDTGEKILTLEPVTGSVLDTATGLGYTALAAARTAAEVVTIEFDPAAREIARLNPWSRGLFDHPAITCRMGDSFDLVREYAPGAFQRIIHDPPVFTMAGHLYSGEFYRELARVLAGRGRLFHYIGNPGSPSGRKVTGGVMRRLREAGFAWVKKAPRAFGVVAGKS